MSNYERPSLLLSLSSQSRCVARSASAGSQKYRCVAPSASSGSVLCVARQLPGIGARTHLNTKTTFLECDLYSFETFTFLTRRRAQGLQIGIVCELYFPLSFFFTFCEYRGQRAIATPGRLTALAASRFVCVRSPL